MEIFKNVTECIIFSKCAINLYPSLKKIIETKDFTTWTDKLNKSSDFRDMLIGENSKLNLLNTSVLIGLSIDKSLDDTLFAYYKMLFKKADLYLESFPKLKTNKNFKDKLKNIENLNFLSTLSELSLAYKLKESGFSIKFETKFKQSNTGRNRDVDISISDNKNNETHFEVYMPNKQLDLNGFFDLHQDDAHFSSKIEQKLIDKFGQDGITGLNGQVLLAINKVFFDMIHVKTILPFFSVENAYNDLIKLIPKDVDGLLIYEDEFGHENSFRFERIMLKK
ncbi:MAG: hypothetical protein WD077_01265 [Bacteroidia bacterium]